MKILTSGSAWTVLAGLFLNYMAVIGIRTSVLPLFYPYLLTEFGWSSAQVTTAATVGYFLSAGLSALVSPLFDRFSVRNIMLIGIVSISSALLLYDGISSISHMIAIYMLLAFGQACCGQVPVMVLAARWFTYQRGLAIGIVMTSTSVGGAIFPLLMSPELAGGDWRSAAATLAWLNAALLIGPWLLLIRNKAAATVVPAGLDAADENSKPTPLRPLSRVEFSLLALVTGGIWFIVNGMLQHQSIIMSSELQVASTTIPLIVSVYFWFAIIGKILSGYLADRCNKSVMLLLGVASLTVGLLVIRAFGDGLLYVYAAFFGFGFGSTASMMQILIAEYYAGPHYGKILGVLTMIDIAAGGLGIPTMALLQGYFGSYMPVLNLLLAICAIVAAGTTCLWLRRRDT
jgi:MFS family permease